MTVYVEEKWWSDSRRSKLEKLVGLQYVDGTAIQSWRLAKEYSGEIIPFPIFILLNHASALIESGLAEVVNNGVYIKGSHKLYSRRRNAGKMAASRREEKKL